MTQQDIQQQVQKEILYILQNYGINCFEFSITQSPTQVYNGLNKNAPKITIWFSLLPSEISGIYKSITEQYQLPYDKTLQGQYLYILQKCFDKKETFH